jgi:two-component system cell cycle response regulator
MTTGAATIFIADDNPVLLQGLERALSSNGYTVHTADSGSALLEMLESARTAPDLLLLDVMMPGMSGFEVLQTVHGDPRWADLPIMLITAANDEMLSVSALKEGAVDFLTKPFRLGELLARVEAHVQRYRTLRKARAESIGRLHAIDVVRDLNAAVTASEMFHLVTSRAAEIWGVSRCSVVVYDGEGVGRVVASSEAEGAVGMLLELQQYPEIRAALETGTPLLVEDVSTSPLFRDMRDAWEAQGVPAPLRSVIVVPLGITESTQGALILRSTDAEPPLGEEAAAIAVQIVDGMIRGLGRAQIFESLIEQRHQLNALAYTDDLTGCASRRSLLRNLKEEFFLARRHQSPLSIVLLDLDDFKEINDTYGHLAGDTVLRALGEWLRGEGSLRARDCAGRYGGDEFMILLPQTTSEGAITLAERARSYLSSVPFVFDGTRVYASLSAGVASWSADDETQASTPTELIALADEALYAAKAAGRDTTRLAESKTQKPRKEVG